MRQQAQFTSTEMRILYEIVDKFGGDDKPELMRELKSLLRYDRIIMKERIFSALKKAM
ncbi:MAG TPA: hypothetical protein VK982_04450 [Bacteroidales bacterium]|jgi:hypothetical protein|nr:hypothetical protein [Bacteroidales bacterium]